MRSLLVAPNHGSQRRSVGERFICTLLSVMFTLANEVEQQDIQSNLHAVGGKSTALAGRSL